MGLFFLIAAIAIFFWVSRNALSLLIASANETASIPSTVEHRRLLDLANRKRVALRNLRALEHDFDTGKLGEGDYEHLRNSAREEAVRVLRALDEEGRKLRYKQRIQRDLDSFAEQQRPSYGEDT